ncbi:MAG: hypothetical protein M0Z41_01100 [Peptococcaceae bacterium]|jgi:hypothetical protein|nr:hypothetical protein [Peptococcaceae bacterium]
MRSGLLDPARTEIGCTTLSKGLIIETLLYHYGRTGFPGFIYIALEDCLACDKGSVVNMLYDNESSQAFIPLARIDELVLNIPNKEVFVQYCREKHGVTDYRAAGPETKDALWRGYDWQFAASVGEIRIEWEQ